ncbi:hypothetical protein A2291_06050 [candidate division WOR-1 bacterium RIFOXYB2_FULL_42_35]|uniref:RNA polymerase sigma-70 region 4 domain-containing protein n=1 Tax=candidate division WOR-1 bacterium RIFOXYC2_FULL_41_25 TaxID=1802586 RepID=A0A1F4TJM9_UNCSA|nr:MAG: hypothetical protein A2247_01710 [candidate division WOR-1 bacterium RIFOXYA2_FULL_41_14]OGC22287.1 MAG: hypothetical protein A2291_06050 [candidate division WOR-1 bacterium RIFOXYB2_FULL_42_35]OGC32906.1 MAG: hypothetical protein A2462_00725 [candidate division WOR-1 bacterium RIFOXYC2_FULL_41_25]OGC41714.1 MAG: hypothetical protein A2548_04965 [candidate division WOR-1 bacterium RIFOXYD2_FULL_41_8]
MDNQEWFERFKVKFLPTDSLERVGSHDEHYYYERLSIKGDKGLIQSTLLKLAVQTLPPLERKIVKLIFFEEYTEREVSKCLKMSKSKIHRTKNKALKMLSRSVFLHLSKLPQQKPEEIEEA